MFTSLKTEQGQDLKTHAKERWQPALWLPASVGKVWKGTQVNAGAPLPRALEARSAWAGRDAGIQQRLGSKMHRNGLLTRAHGGGNTGGRREGWGWAQAR